MVKGRLCKSLIRRFESDRRLHFLFPAGCLLAIALSLYGGGLLPGRSLVPFDLWNAFDPFRPEAGPLSVTGVSNPILSDVVFQLDPWDVVVRDALAEGRPPFVNPWSGGEAGEAVLANPQTALLSPFTWPRLLLGRRGWAVTAILKLLVAGLGARALARRLGAGPRAALASGAVYALSGFAVVWVLHPPSNVSPLLPWIAAFSLDVLREGSRRSVVGLAAASAMATAGGHPETLFHGVVGIGAWLLLEARSRRERVLVPAVRTAGASLSGFLALGVLLVPFFHVLSDSTYREARLERPAPPFRWPAVLAQMAPGFAGMPLAGEIDLSIAHRDLENVCERSGGYVGLATLVLLLAGLHGLHPTARRGLAVGTVALLVSWGVPPLGWVFQKAPVFSLAANGRLFVLFALFASAAAGPAIAAAVRASRRGLAAAALVIAGAILAAAGAGPLLPPGRALATRALARGASALRAEGVLHRGDDVYAARTAAYLERIERTAVRRALLPGLATLIAGLALLRGRRPGVVASAVLAELLLFAWGFAPSVPLPGPPPPAPLLDEIRRRDPESRFHLAAFGPVLPPNGSVLYRLRDVRAYDPLISSSHAAELRRAGIEPLLPAGTPGPTRETRSVFARLGVRWVLSRDAVADLPRTGGEAPPGLGLYEVPEARATVPPPNSPPRGLWTGIAVSLAGLALALVTIRTARPEAPAARARTATPGPPVDAGGTPSSPPRSREGRSP